MESCFLLYGTLDSAKGGFVSLDIASRFFDLWVFRKTSLGPQYLLFYTSREKADRFFAGGRFWQIPTDAVEDDEDVETACRDCSRVLD